ncbi:hypothetical protein F3168_06770 [Polymorphobacter fuscus]|uniref:Cell wall polymerase n=2 Tax=Sandarakinorhabdus fusca TaxID=1439888 RepID=A0A7C9KI37_9SPHN|nr:hypothetical protein F9290_06770 [Polymorphobacter fuscus]MQT16959.1 hypothetical protein [Polymorphobacter fuscus]
MASAVAPMRYLAINVAALVIGLALLALIVRNRRDAAGTGMMVLAAATALLATMLSGTMIDGVARWVSIGGIVLQPSLILLPLMVAAFARTRDAAGTGGMVIAAVALALQPDRAMAGALLAGMAAMAIAARDRHILVALAAAAAGFAAALLQPDTLAPTPYVEQAFGSAFAVSTVVGLGALTGAALLLLPMAVRGDAALPVFAATWLAIFVAAILGNYPTPFIGYGGSGIIGYLLSLAALPGRLQDTAGGRHRSPADSRDGPDRHALLAPTAAC